MSGPSDVATTQTPAPGPTPSRTAAPSVLQQRAPSIRYIDAKQSDAIMESGTKSATVSQLSAAGQCCLLYKTAVRQQAQTWEVSILYSSRLRATHVHQGIWTSCTVTLNWLACNCGWGVGPCSIK